MSFKHHDEARTDTVNALLAWIAASPESKAVLIDDLYGKYRVILWPGPATSLGAADTVREALAPAADAYWSGQIWVVTPETSKLDLQVYDSAWTEGRPHPDQPQLRLVDRVRSRVAWFGELAEPPWKAGGAGVEKGPPIVVFYSFKGGVGRTTALASFAIQRARAGDRVVIIDGDLDAPGIGPLMSTATQIDSGANPPTGRLPDAMATGELSWGVVDYLLETPFSNNADLSDYYQSVRDEPIIPGAGEIVIFPAGRIDENYLAKLARLDFDPARKGTMTPWTQLLDRIRKELNPHWILLDSRAGLGEPAGLLLGGMAHLHVLLGTSSEQSWQGIRLILDRIGSGRVHVGKPQAECVLVQTMIPEFHDSAVDAKTVFLARSENEFADHYYAEDTNSEEDDSMWSIRDMSAKDAPHQPVSISYKQNLAHFRALKYVLNDLLGEEYQNLAKRIQSRFVEEEL